MEPYFIVSGMHRSGTSAAMRACVEGGIPGNYDPNADKARYNAPALKRHGEYNPNPNGFYEGRKVPLLDARGMVTKCILAKFRYDDPSLLPQAPCKVLMMHRSREEREASLNEWHWAPGGIEARLAFDEWLEKFNLHMPWADVFHLNYAFMVCNPDEAFRELHEHGWPIDPAKAAATIDPTLWRHKAGQAWPPNG